MKKIYFFSLLSLIAVSISAQQAVKPTVPPAEDNLEIEDVRNDLETNFYSKRKYSNKAFGDTLFYEDFRAGLAGWTVINNNPNNFVWEWDTVYRQGAFSGTRTEIKSTTAGNGFMSLPSDFYNTPTPSTGRVGMDTYFQSDTIFITPTPSVWVTYQQYVRFCCNSGNRLVLQVSTDDFVTFTEFDAIDGLPVNTGNTTNTVGGATNIINISTAVANAPNFKVRFYAEGNGRYFWMIDDFAVIEGVENDVELRTPYLEFNFDYAYNPFYGQIPYNLFTPLPLSGFVYNNGSNDLTGVKIEGDIFHTASANAGPGVGLIYSTASAPLPLQSGVTRDTADYVVTNNPRFVPTILGEFRVDMIATSDSVDGNLGNETYSQTFTTSDTIFARDDNGYAGGTGPGSYVRNSQTGGTVVGDRFGTMYVVESRTGNGGSANVPTSITFAVSDDPANIGVEIVPNIWSYNEDSLFTATGSIAAAFAGGMVASAFIPYTILSTDTNTLLTLPLDNGSGVVHGLDSGQYVVGWEVTNTNGGNSFEVQEDASSGIFQDNVTCFIDLAHSPGWGWVDSNPVIRLNFGNPTFIGLNNVTNFSTEFNITPNPNNGLFTMTVTSKETVNYNVTVKNMLGQQVYADLIAVNGTVTEQMDLTQFEKGVYFVSLENGAEKILKKVVVK
ncbi:MAG: hypothetical protein ACI9DK_000431 [Vicingaceae bacterium]|jgi:hypothetical protein